MAKMTEVKPSPAVRTIRYQLDQRATILPLSAKAVAADFDRYRCREDRQRET
jgi:hypothetical protein